MSQQLMPPQRTPRQASQHIRPQHLLDHPMGPLGLAVALRVERGRKSETSPHDPHKSAPKLSCEARIPIRHNRRRYAEVPDNSIKKQPSCLPRTKILAHRAWRKSNQLGEAVHTRENRVEPPAGRQPGDEIHGPRFETRLGDLQWLHLSRLGLRRIFHTLTYGTRSHVFTCQPLHVRPPYPGL